MGLRDRTAMGGGMVARQEAVVRLRACRLARREERAMPICPANGHFIEDPAGPYCSRHGVPWFEHCSRCGAEWTTGRQDPTNYLRVVGDEYCARCAAPAPWLSRAD